MVAFPDAASLKDGYISFMVNSLTTPFPLIYDRDVMRKVRPSLDHHMCCGPRP